MDFIFHFDTLDKNKEVYQAMDLSHIQEHYEELLSYMEQKGYSDTYIIRFHKETQRILGKADNNDWTSYWDIYNDHEKVPHSKDYLRNKRTIIGALEQFDLKGLFPDGRRRHSLYERGSYHLLSPEFRQLIDFYINADRERGKKDSTIYSEARNTASFLHHLQDRGCAFLHDVSEEDVLSFFVTEDGRRIRSCSYRKNISAVFRSGLKWKEKECRTILSFLPILREKCQNIQYLTETEVMVIRETVTNGTLSYRNTAIISLLLYTGLRACDISGLITDSIDWERETVKICQQKTEMPLELPLSPIVGNAIFDYLQLERPDSGDPHLFLSEVKHYTPLKSGSIGNIVSKCLLISSIRQNAGDRKGTHIFRHNLAVTLLSKGVSRPVISETLGHTAPDSLEPYLRADFLHLKECALSISNFPVLEEVLSR